MRLQILFVAFLFSIVCHAQNDTVRNETALHPTFFQPAFSYNQKRTIGVVAGETCLASGSLVALSQVWYKDYPRTSFHFFNDNGEWLQMDKCGHATTAY